jgi:3-deoxy-D-arabino-heptulosonate 7-phosphate (DAHP) synthase class II
MDWLVKRANNVDVEREHLNKILQEIRSSITSLENLTGTGGGNNGSNNVDVERAHLNKILQEIDAEMETKLAIAALTAGTNITLTYDEVAGTLTIDATGGSGTGNSYNPSGW